MSAPAAALPAGMHVFERGWLSSNNILFCAEGKNVLVDTGYLTHAPQTLSLLQHVLQGAPLHQIVNTHLHSDHCGGNALLQQHYGCHTSIPHLEAEKVRRWDQEQLSYLATGQSCQRFDFHATIAPGDCFVWGQREWQALAAPGHDPHSLMFYCAEEQILISADALWQRGFGVIFPELEGESGFAETRATLELIASLKIRLVIPGHGAPFSDSAAALDYAFARIDFLQSEPVRNAQNALKVLLKFLLLERQQIALAELPALMAEIPLFKKVNLRFLQQESQALAEWAVQQLLHSRVARIDGAYLCNAD
ncbi:MAG: MBL fold metallo-hydrolase [Burkholderiales bacterium]|nr:MBL fold metallo-hydrolase [Burkholderiales bacterium]